MDQATVIITEAKRHKGVPFKRAVPMEEVPAYFDCSAFTQFVFGFAGVELPRRAYQQAQCGTVISNPADLRRGDLLFFAGHPAGRELVIVDGKEYGVGHVAIYAGNGRIVNATRKFGVRVSRLTEKRKGTIVLMKRVLPDAPM